MLIVKDIDVKWHGFTRDHYESLGYVYTKKDHIFTVSTDELSPGSNLRVQYLCDYCGEENTTKYHTLIESKGVLDNDCCKSCAYKKHNEIKILNAGTVLSEYPEIAKEWLYEENETTPDSVTPYSKKKVRWRCSEGHSWSSVVYARTSGSMSGCPFCKETIGEKKVSEDLVNLSVPYIQEVSIDDLRGLGGGLLRFDFAILSDEGYIRGMIEFDGPFHYDEVYEGDNFEGTQAHDKIKNEFCEDYNIPLLRIPYWEIDNTLEKIKVFLERI